MIAASEVTRMAASRDKFAINEPFYQWSVRAFSAVHKRVGMKIAVHAGDDVLESGQIFLFNHFARFETLIPQYFIYQATGAYCRCLASHELFESSERFAKVLWGVGAVPSNHPGLLAFLAAEMLRGQKVIIFPEGSMMKDRSIAAPPHERLRDFFKTRIGHRQGAAALAVTLELFKKRILSVEEAGDTERLDRWVAALGLADRDALIASARKPTLVVPSNITFHPIHRGDNFLLKAADMLKFNLGQRGREELMVEGNLLLRKTDMDIRFGKPVHPDIAWNMADRMVLARMFDQIDNLQDLFGLKDKADHWVDKLVAATMQRATRRLRDHCMVEMYANVTLNISHLAARLLMRFAAEGKTEVGRHHFHALLYAAIKAVQKEQGLNLHASITDPDVYGGIAENSGLALEQFYATAADAGLIALTEDVIRLKPSLLAETTDEDPRLANMVRVYANEIASLTNVIGIIDKAAPLSGVALAEALFDDELRAYERDKAKNAAQLGNGVANEQEKRDGAPFLLRPETATKVGVVLVHGFLASPAETRGFGERLVAEGHPVFGVRLKGHGTSPHDLRTRTQEEWQASVGRGYKIMSQLTHDVAVTGFGTGGSLALLLAAGQPHNLVFVGAVSAPLTFRLQNLRYSPLLHKLNQLGQWVYLQNGVKPFMEGVPERPDIEYRNMPVQALIQLRKVADLLEQRLPDVQCPVMIVQGTEDPVVNPDSASAIEAKIGSKDKSLHMIVSERHGILVEDIGGVQQLILQRLGSFAIPQPEKAPPLRGPISRIKSNLAVLLPKLRGSPLRSGRG
jgi:esterase/lipase